MGDEKQTKKKDIKALMNLNIKDIKLNFKNSKKEKYNKKNIISFDIDEQFIHIVVGKYQKGTLVISKLIDVPTPKNSINDGKIFNKEVIIDTLRRVLKENKIKAKYASFTTNSTLIINREMIIPNVEDDEIDTVINFEISQYLPINLNDYIIQTTILEDIEVNGVEKLKVHTTCYPDKIARSYYDILKELKLKPYTLDVKPNSLKKLINYSQEINDQEYYIENTNVFVDIGPLTTDINIYKNGEIDFTRIIKFGYKHMEEYIDNNYGLDYLIEEIEKIFQFYKNKNRSNKIDKVYLLGRGSRLRGLDGYLSSKVDLEVEKINYIGYIDFKNKSLYDEGIYKYMNAIGTIIRL